MTRRTSTSIDAEVPDVVGAARTGADGDLRGIKIGVVRQLRGDGYQEGVLASFNAAVEKLTELGAEVSEVDCPHFDYSLPAYYLILPSEVSSNLARFDAMRTGLRVGDDGTHSAEEVMAMTRAAGSARGQAPHHDWHLRTVGRATTTRITTRRRRFAR
jgi:aspartyl-tRNA(Asn)/glutamyl-tRNA(Gln) amidotransferase subunit A